MELVMREVLSDKRTKGSVYQWAGKVAEGVQEKAREFFARHEEDEKAQNFDIDFEFVNHSEFVDFVRQCAAESGEKPSEEMINVFVHVFREWYNNR